MTEIYEFESSQDKGFERFVKSSVIIGPQVFINKNLKLDIYAREIFDFFVKGEFRVYRAVATVEWKTKEDRLNCIAHEIKKGRWKHVENYSRLMHGGNWHYSGMLPVFIHPAAFNSPMNVLKPVDGARRIMAHLETNQNNIPILVVKPWIPANYDLMHCSQTRKE